MLLGTEEKSISVFFLRPKKHQHYMTNDIDKLPIVLYNIKKSKEVWK